MYSYYVTAGDYIFLIVPLTELQNVRSLNKDTYISTTFLTKPSKFKLAIDIYAYALKINLPRANMCTFVANVCTVI